MCIRDSVEKVDGMLITEESLSTNVADMRSVLTSLQKFRNRTNAKGEKLIDTTTLEKSIFAHFQSAAEHFKDFQQQAKKLQDTAVKGGDNSGSNLVRVGGLQTAMIKVKDLMKLISTVLPADFHPKHKNCLLYTSPSPRDRG